MADYTLTKVTRNGQITLPASVRRAFRVAEGDYLEVQADADGIRLVPKKLIDSSQAYFWSNSWQAGEQEASLDLAAGRVAEARDADDLVARLDETRKKKC
jgi:AbrB family looped-hinge helix DNA binding protein